MNVTAFGGVPRAARLPQLDVRALPHISAIYFGLLQSGYDYYALGKDASLVCQIEQFLGAETGLYRDFFEDARQSTCAAYPYWPRAAAMETAAFFVDFAEVRFTDFEAYRSKIMSASNISAGERDDGFWTWISGFPAALHTVAGLPGFERYLCWERQWLESARSAQQGELTRVRRIAAQCGTGSITDISIVLCPIKCAYSSDYFAQSERLYCILGELRADSVIHELLHPAVHPFALTHADEIDALGARWPGIDDSYYAAGAANAFEEYAVRELTARAMADNFPQDVDMFLRNMAASF